MGLHFTKDEFASRLNRCRRKLQEQNLDGILLFKQESMYYLTGFDRVGYLSFQTLFIGIDGSVTLLTRRPDALLARHNSIISDIEVWIDRTGVNPAEEIRRILEARKMRGKRLGVEYHAVGLSTQRGKMLDAALEGFCHLQDASALVDDLRRVKSEAEIAYVRKAATLAEAMYAEANRLSVPGTFEGDIYAAMYDVVMRNDGDPPGSGTWVLGSGETAHLMRYQSGHRRLAENDLVTHEFGAAYRRYHACLMHCVVIGEVDPRHRAMFEACRNALDACKEVARPGHAFGTIFDTFAKTMSDVGFGHMIFNACGYSLGASYPPSWAEEPFMHTGNPLPIEPGMVLFPHLILIDQGAGLTMSLGETVLVTEGACEPLTHAPRELIVR
ncbi:M24 family metallopeptidase [Mesorhizobium amorphae]|uniref:M24 family metallopeptidase n=1 Tax=Mesorhizobium amorphae TaxID=71433 RepID=UPI001783854B|nr:Xaa-Pro peptidase family protein [Mesorhizobium amorphae]